MIVISSKLVAISCFPNGFRSTVSRITKFEEETIRSIAFYQLIVIVLVGNNFIAEYI